jgi:hypothetical protein
LWLEKRKKKAAKNKEERKRREKQTKVHIPDGSAPTPSTNETGMPKWRGSFMCVRG